MINFSGYNIGCFTLPFIQSFIGPAGVVATCLFDAGNSVMCTGATYSIAKAAAGGKVQRCGVFEAHVFKLSEGHLHRDGCIGGLRTHGSESRLKHHGCGGGREPLSRNAHDRRGVELHLDRNSVLRVAGVLLGCYSMAAVLAWVFWNFAPFEAEVRKVLAVIAFAPVSAVCTIFTGMCFNDARLVALSCTINSLSIVISIACMTALILVL